MTPTTSQWNAYQAAFDHFNATLFDGCLAPVVLNFSRKAKSYGFFAPDRWVGDGGEGQEYSEISLNPTHLAERPLIESMSTLVHEMVHAWQYQHGLYPRRPYHNRQWAAKMKECGLYPSDTGAPGGRETGQRMTHYVIPGGVYEAAFRSLPPEALLPLVCRDGTAPAKKKARNKVKYSCDGCGCNVWGKPEIRITCDGCGLAFSAEDGEEP